MLKDNYVPDQSLKAILDFIDIDDPSTVNTLYASISKVYERMAKNEYVINYTTESIKLESEQHTDTLAKKFFDTFTAILSNN